MSSHVTALDSAISVQIGAREPSDLHMNQ